MSNSKASKKPANKKPAAKVKKDRPQLARYSKDPITAVPTDYDPAKHTRLKRADFATADVFHDFRAGQLRLAADAAELRAANIRANGTGTREEKRARKMVEQLMKLKETLAASGVEVDLSSLTS